MKYYKDENNEVYAYESDGSQDAYIKPGLIPITEEKMLELTTPKIETTTVEELLETSKNELRILRKPALDAVNGIGWRAMMAGDTQLANEALQVSLALLDITDDPALNAATTYQDMKIASVLAYKRIATGVSEALDTAFRETLGD